MQAEAHRLAGAMPGVIAADTANMRCKIRKTQILMSTTSTISNGYTSLFPYKAVLYAKPSDDDELSTMDWYQNLITHEYRHIVQYNLLNQGFTRLGYSVLGNYVWGGLSYSVPQWWYEGDAVYAETVLSSSGRGRSAMFESPIKANIQDLPKLYPYEKMIHRSFRDMIPNHYPLGYMLATSARRKYGADIWHRVAHRQSRYSFWPFAFGVGFRRETSESLKSLYKSTFEELRGIYAKNEGSAHNYSGINPQKKKIFTSFTNPRLIGSNRILCLKSSMANSVRMVVLDTLGNQIVDLGLTDASSFDTDGRVAVYASNVPDIRWTMRSYSDVALVDLKTGARRLITHRQKYFTPAISPGGQRIAVVEFTDRRQCAIVVLHADSAHGYSTSVMAKYTFQDMPNAYMRLPRFLDDNHIAFVSTACNRNSIQVLDLATMQAQVWLPYTSCNIHSIATSADGKIYYTSDHNGINNVYSVDSQGVVEQYTQTSLGANRPCVVDGKLLFSQYSRMGYDIVMRDLQPLSTGLDSARHTAYYQPLIDSEPSCALDFISEHKPGENYQAPVPAARRFRQLSNPVRLFGLSPNFTDNSMSLLTESQNTLETLTMTAQATYHLDPNYWRYGINATYSGLYPEIQLQASLGDNADNVPGYTIDGQPVVNRYFWTENIFSAMVSVPMNFSRFHYNRKLQGGVGLSYYNISEKPFQGYSEMGDGNHLAMKAQLQYSWSLPQAYRDFKSPMSFSAAVNYTRSLQSDWKASLLAASMQFTMPGFFRQNYLTMQANLARQSKEPDPFKVYMFSNSAFDVHGYMSQRLQKINKFTLDYSFPMGYPDGGIPCVVWIKRMRGSLLGSLAQGKLFYDNPKFASVGFRFLVDFCSLRLNYDITAGVLVSKGLISNGLEKTQCSFILNLPL